MLGIIHSVNFKIFLNISYPLIRIRTCAYQGVGNISFLENVLNVLNECLLNVFKKYFNRNGNLKAEWYLAGNHSTLKEPQTISIYWFYLVCNLVATSTNQSYLLFTSLYIHKLQFISNKLYPSSSPHGQLHEIDFLFSHRGSLDHS